MEENTAENSDSIDKSKILEIKPLRSLAPVLPKSFSPGQYPPGFPPFFAFEKAEESPIPKETQEAPIDEATPDAKTTQEAPIDEATPDAKTTQEAPIDEATPDAKTTQETPEAKVTQATPVTKVTPLRSYKGTLDEEATSQGVGYDDSLFKGSNGDGVTGKKKRKAPDAQNGNTSVKKEKKPKVPVPQVEDLSSLVGISSSQRLDGDRETVNCVLMMFESVRRRLCQLEESKELITTGANKYGYMRASSALTSRGVRTNMTKRVGAVPGVEVGDIFFFRWEMILVGLHSQPMGGIDSLMVKDQNQAEPVAISVVSSGVYDDHAEDDDILIYSGQGENFNKKDKHVTDQKLRRGNLSLDKSTTRRNEIRVIRGLKYGVKKDVKIYMYDGLYRIQDSWIDRGKSGGGVFKYKLERLPGQPSAYAVWKSVQKWKEGSTSRNGLILADLTTGAESIPVSLVNDVDDEKGPAFFTYFNSLKNPKPFSGIQHSYSCNCNKACVPGDLSCSCVQRNEGDFPYIANGILVSRKPMIHECGPMCQCLPNCKNRTSQSGVKHHMEVFKTKERGWGLRTLDPIRAGTFICEYAGEVIDRAIVGDNDEYVFDTSRIYEPFKWNHEPRLLEEISSNVSSEDYAIPSPLVISAKDVGNVARFMNHSCSPNVFWQPVLYGENNQSFLHIAFFALRHIPPMTELTYDYGNVPAGDADSVPAGDAENVPAGDAESVPAGDAENVPAGDAENVPAGDAESVPAGDAENVPAGDAESVPAGDAENVPAGDAEKSSAPIGRKKCLCGSAKCRGFFC